ncbi:MAG: TlpA family protein disulfide reductase [Fimbriimonadia bacterium]|nr:TlpA family protein disulfide reductase [Fimbriimonadia bacterium]
MKQWTLWAAIALITVSGSALLTQQNTQEKPKERPKVIEVGVKAPDFEVEMMDGKKVKLSSLRGKPVFLDFWATWCPPCRASLPHTQDFSKRFAGKAHIIGVNLREDEEKIKPFMEKGSYSFPVALDRDGSIAQKYGVSGIPTFIVIDAEGTVAFVQVGFSAGVEKKFETAMENALKQ